MITQGPSPEDDYGLEAIAQHNAIHSTEQFPPYEEDAKGLGIYSGSLFHDDDQIYVHNPPTPRSGTASEGVRTRSGRSARRTDSPFSTSKSRVSKSPATRSKKEKKPSKLDKSKTPKLTAPLSILTKDMDVPLKDMDAWVHRPAETRRKEVEKRNGYVTRPMNSFMLYRSCYAERTKQWCLQNNHQVVSSVSGESWPMEPEEVRNQFNEWAKIERANHAAAHPEYKFSPSKASNKRKKGDFSDDEDDASELDGDPDGEYRGGSRTVRQKRLADNAAAVAYLPSNVGFESHPYYGQQYEQPQYAYTSEPGRPLPSNAGYDGSGLVFNPQTSIYVHATMNPHPQYNYMPAQDVRTGGMRVSTPSSMNGHHQSLGGYGLPGNISTDDLFASNSRTGTPSVQAQYNSYGQPVYPQYHSYTPQPAYQSLPQHQQQQMYEHAQYLQQASQPQAAIDPALASVFEESGNVGGGREQSHFEDAMGDLAGGGEYAGMEYFDEPTSPNGWRRPELGGQ
ncbi:uncharacterized protein LTR77_009483 [Saxophila tyrrhenica]|uniref:HMG box domain-containing protein n=1 Tax=Saxophila tyrrhenica TaxID=1690608 RepID=A0AAV9P166_9PEZI|nr:hypothetical protein LTR77_009483 [Saxophila tyrrhenica]